MSLFDFLRGKPETTAMKLPEALKQKLNSRIVNMAVGATRYVVDSAFIIDKNERCYLSPNANTYSDVRGKGDWIKVHRTDEGFIVTLPVGFTFYKRTDDYSNSGYLPVIGIE